MASQRIRGITIEINADNKEFMTAFKKMNQEIKDTAFQLKDVDKLLKLDPTNVDLLTQKQALLTSSIEKVNGRLEATRAELERLGKEDQTAEVIRKQEALQRQIAADEQELKNLQQELRNFGDVGKAQAQAVASRFEEVGRKIQETGDKITGVGKQLTTNVTLPIVAAGTAAVATAADFESGMSRVQAVTGSTAEEMSKLEDVALEMASKTSFTATEAADALYYMGLAGWKSEQMIEGLPAVLNLAAASGEDLAMVSDIVTDALTAFGLNAEDAAEFTDILAATAANSNTTVGMMGEAFKYIAPVAGSLGYDIKDVALALGTMANNGIKGSQAGASLRNVLTRLAKPTKEVQEAMDALGISLEDSDGNMLSLGDVVWQLRESFSKGEMSIEDFSARVTELDDALEDGALTQEEYEKSLEDLAKAAYGVEGAEAAKLASMLGGQRAMASILALVNTSTEDYTKLAEAIDKSEGAAKKMAETMLDNLKGQFTILKSQIEGVSIELGRMLIPAISKGVGKVQELVTAFSKLDDRTKETIIKIAGIVAAVGPALIIIGKMVSAVGMLSSGIGLLIAHPVGAAIGAMVAAIAYGVAKFSIFRDELAVLNDEERILAERARDAAAAYDEARVAREKRSAEINNTFGIYQEEWERLKEIVDEQGKVKSGYEEEAKIIVEKLNEALGTNISLKDGQIERYAQLKRSIEDVIRMKQAEALIEANMDDYVDAMTKQKELSQDLANAYNEREERSAELAELENKMNSGLREAFEAHIEKMENANQRTVRLSQAEQKLVEEYWETQRAIEEATEAQELNDKTIETLVESLEGYNAVIENHEDLVKAMETGSENMEEAVLAFSNTLLRAGSATDKSLQTQYDNYTKTFSSMVAATKEKGSLITKTQVEEVARMVVLSARELDKLGVEYDKSAVEAAQAFIDQMEKQAAPVRVASSKVAEESLRGVREKKPGYGGAADEAVATYDMGLRSHANETKAAGTTMATSGKDGAVAVEFTSAGKSAGNQYASGIEGTIENVKNKAKKVPKAALEAMSGVSAESTGKAFADGFAEGIAKNAAKSRTAAKQLAEAAKGEANYVLGVNSPSTVMAETGRWFDEGFAQGIKRNAETVETAASRMAIGAAEAARVLPDAMSMMASGNETMQAAIGSTNNYGDISIVVNGAQGQDVQQLANIVMDRIYKAVERRQAVMT